MVKYATGRLNGFVPQPADREGTYVWFSPLGEPNHAAAQNVATIMSPIKGAHLGGMISDVKLFKTECGCLPVRHVVCFLTDEGI